MFIPVNPRQAQELLASGSVEVIDVREISEWERGHIAGARPVALASLRSDWQGQGVRDGVLFVCAGGVRSQTAARLAVDHGLKRVYSLTGGTSSWMRADLPLVTELSVAV